MDNYLQGAVQGRLAQYLRYEIVFLRWLRTLPSYSSVDIQHHPLASVSNLLCHRPLNPCLNICNVLGLDDVFFSQIMTVRQQFSLFNIAFVIIICYIGKKKKKEKKYWKLFFIIKRIQIIPCLTSCIYPHLIALNYVHLFT